MTRFFCWVGWHTTVIAGHVGRVLSLRCRHCSWVRQEWLP